MQLSVALQAAVPAEPGGPPPLPMMSAEIDVELRSTHFQHQRRHLPLRVRPAAGGVQRLGAPSLVFTLASPFAPSTPPGGCFSDDSGSLAFPRDCAAQLAASELRFAAFGPRAEGTSSGSDAGGSDGGSGGGGAVSGAAIGSGQEVELLCKGSTTLADVPPNGQALSMEVNMYSGMSPAEDQLVGRLQVELKLSLPRRRGSSRSLGRTRTRTEDAGEAAAMAPQGSSGSGLQSFGSGGVALTRSDSAPQPRGCGRQVCVAHTANVQC